MRIRAITVALLAACASVVAVVPTLAGAWDLAPRHVVERAAVEGRVSVIVELGPGATPEHLLPNATAIAGQRLSIQRARADVRRGLQGLQHRVHREYESIPYMAIELSPDALRVLGAMRGMVTRIEEDLELHPMLAESGPLVQAPAAWASGLNGQGTVIAVIDTGVDKNHPFLQGKVVAEACYARGVNGLGGAGDCPNGLDSQLGPGAALPCADCPAHGTHVAGIAAGNGGPPANVPFSGVAPGANIMAVRITGQTGIASLADVLAALERVYLLRGTYNIAAVNLSLDVPGWPHATTCDDVSPALTTIIQNLKSAGIATVIASGNDAFTNAIAFPSCIASAVSVASSDDGSSETVVDSVSYFSNVAPFVSLLAPGQWITSASFPGGGYALGHGTSIAAPHVSGAFAIMKQLAPTGSVDQFVDALRATGVAVIDAPSVDRPDAESTVVPRILIADALATLPQFQFTSAVYSGAEGAGITITVTRSGRVDAAATVRYATADGTATGGSAYTATSGTLTFPVNATTRTFTVPTHGNTVLGGDKTFQVSLSNPTGGAGLGMVDVASVTIQEDDTAGTFQFSSPTYSATEGGPAATITVTRTGVNLASGVTIGYATSNGTATAGTDYTATSGALTFGAGVTSMVFTVPLVNNAALEPDETVNLTLMVPAGSPAMLGTPASAVLTIHDDDGPTFRFSTASQTVAEGASATIVVMRGGSLTSPSTVEYQVRGGTAIGGGIDFTLADGTLSFAAGQASKTLVIPTVNDTLFEGPETIVLQLANPTGGATIATPGTTTITIVDNESAGTVQFSAATYSVAENVAGGTYNLLVTRSGSSLASDIVVSYTVAGGTATNGVDYTLANGSLTFAAGQTSLPIPMLIHDDSIPEGNETVVITLSSATATIGPNRTTTVTILDDEPALTFSAPAYSATEGTASVVIPILRAGPTPAGTTVTCRTVPGGSAIPDVDYRAVNTTLTFAAGSRTATCAVPLLNDTVVDGPRTVNLALSVPPTSPGLLGSPATAILTLNDNDQGGTLKFGAATYTAAEGGTARLTVTRTGTGLASGVTVDYAVTGGTATRGAVDYTLANGTLTFAANQASATIAVPTVNDTLAEGVETVVVTLSNPTGGAALGTPSTTTLTITDNDTAGTVRFSAAAYSVAENVAGGVYNLVVTRSGTGLASGIAVNYTVAGGTAVNGVDYTLADGTLTFGAGQTSLPIPVLIHDNSVVGASKTVVVSLSSTTAKLGPVAAATITILDDEQVMAFGAATYALTEGGAPSIAIPVLRTGPTPAGTTVTCRTVPGGSAIPDVDYRAVNTTLTFAAGARSVSCVVPILNDTLVDGARTVNLALAVAPGGSALLGAPATAVLTLNDNDQGGAIRFGAATYTVAEGAVAMLTVVRSGTNLASGVTVDYAVTGGTASGAGVDYTLANGTLTFAAKQTSATIALATVNDTLVEGPRTVVVALSNPTSGASLGSPAATTLTITDSDTAGTVRFSAAAYSVAENVAGGVYNLLVTRSGTSLASGIVVNYTVTGGTATNGVDYTLANGSLTFAAGQTSLPIPVLIYDNASVGANKTVVVSLSSTAATLGSIPAATLTILDDE